jgi:hypothetical protein
MKGWAADVELLWDDSKPFQSSSAFSGYHRGRCLVKACALNPTLVGTIQGVQLKNAVSMAPYFVYRISGWETSKDQLVRVVANKSLLDAASIAYLKAELEDACTDEERDAAFLELGSKTQISLDFIEQSLVLHPLVFAHSELMRMQYLQPLLLYFLRKGAPDQRLRISQLPTMLLRALALQLRNAPWELMFREPLKSTYNRIKPLSFASYSRACVDFGIQPPIHIDLALCFLCRVSETETETHHSLFDWVTHAKVVLGERFEMETQVRDYLVERVFMFPFPIAQPRLFTFHDYWDDAKRIGMALLRYHQQSTVTIPALRSPQLVPALPPRLQGAQLEAATSILNNCVTVLEGYPGTGKTAIITWAMAHFKNVLLLTLTGAMASSLRARNGGRDEAAHTIDRIIYAAYNAQYSRKWLTAFDVLIIDEFSNVSTAKLAKLLWLLPNLVRIIFVGDHNQIASRKAGDALGDLRRLFPLIQLRTILRVASDPAMSALYEVPCLLAENKFNQLRWHTSAGPLTLVEPTPSQWNKREKKYASTAAEDKVLLRNLLQEIWRIGGRHLMHHQIVVLQNSMRKALNEMCQALALEEGIIKSTATKYQIGDQEYCVGTKIAFTRNYNKVAIWTPPKTNKKQASIEGSTVVNGECGVITNIRTLPGKRGHAITFAVNDKPPIGKTKTIICSSSIKDAVLPLHITLGYAITTTKVQGQEYPYVIFWNNRGLKPFWTRSHLYVALTRGKQRVWCVSERKALETIYSTRDTVRRTVLYDTLQQHFVATFQGYKTLCAGTLPPPNTHYMLMPGSVPCVPRLADVQAEEAKKKKKQQKDDEDLYLACFAAHSAHRCVLQEVHTWLVSLAAHILHPKYRTRFLTPSLVTILAGLIQYSWPR